MTPIGLRVTQPSPEEVRQARLSAKLTQAEAARLVSPAQERADRTWQSYESDAGKKGHRAIPLATWELFLLLTGQHPSLQLISKAEAAAG